MCPEFNPVQDNAASPLETTGTVTVSVLGVLCVREIVEDGCFSFRGSGVRYVILIYISETEMKSVLTWVLLRKMVSPFAETGKGTLAICSAGPFPPIVIRVSICGPCLSTF